MNVIFVSDYGYVNGGATSVAIQSALALACQKINVAFFCAVGPVHDALYNAGVQVCCLDGYDLLGNPSSYNAALNAIWNRDASVAFSQFLENFSQEDTIVHIHTWTKALSSSVMRVALEKNYKVLLTMHDYFTVCPNGGFYDFQKGAACGVRAMSVACLAKNCDSRKYSHKLFRVFRQVIQNSIGGCMDTKMHYAAVSDFSRRIIADYLPRNSDIHMIRNPVSIDRQERVDVRKNKNFVFVGRLSIEKGADLFAEAARIAEVPSVFIGDGDLCKKVKELNDGAELVGWVRQDEIKDFLAEARALVFPSRLYETLGLSVIEAFARGIPVVVADGIAATELIDESVNGWIFRNGDAGSLSAVLIQIASNDELVDRVGLNAYERYWHEPWNLEQHVTDSISAYKKILSADMKIS